jgi:hypothetical protein
MLLFYLTKHHHHHVDRASRFRLQENSNLLYECNDLRRGMKALEMTVEVSILNLGQYMYIYRPVCKYANIYVNIYVLIYTYLHVYIIGEYK